MVSFLTEYQMYEEAYHSSREYREGTEEVRGRIDKWLNRQDVKEYYGKRFVMRLTLQEQLILEHLNSEDFKKKTHEEKDKEIKLLTSKAAEVVSKDIERLMRGEEMFKQREYTSRPVPSWFHY